MGVGFSFLAIFSLKPKAPVSLSFPCREVAPNWCCPVLYLSMVEILRITHGDSKVPFSGTTDYLYHKGVVGS